jgi:hypothetical protein
VVKWTDLIIMGINIVAKSGFEAAKIQKLKKRPLGSNSISYVGNLEEI